ncbi:MAG: homoserine kinase [Arachnia sp.]
MTSLSVRVAASTANLGSGFDAMGIGLDLYDEVSLTSGGDSIRVRVTGEGADSVPLDESHLVVRSLLAGLSEFDGSVEGFELVCHNSIPHSRGLGSSAAAIVAGLCLAWGIARDGELDRREILRLADQAEGHPDNAAAAVFGGAVLAWRGSKGVDLLELPLHPKIECWVLIPEDHSATKHAREVLPESVPRSHAVHQAIRAALLSRALTDRPDLLLEATGDLLHQNYRRELMPESMALVDRLRQAGVAAAISGAGPAVMCFADPAGTEIGYFTPRRVRPGHGASLRRG